MEFITGNISISFGGSPVSYCVFPGNNIDGYCNEKEKTLTLYPFCLKLTANELLKFAIPPRNGKAGPIIIMFLFKINFLFRLGNYFYPEHFLK